MVAIPRYEISHLADAKHLGRDATVPGARLAQGSNYLLGDFFDLG